MTTPKLKGTRAQERVDRSNKLQDRSKIIGYILIEPKLFPHSMGRIMNIADALIS